jgi:hypothetical protein
MNISNFYTQDAEIKNDSLKIYLIFSLIGIFIFSHLINGIVLGKDYANNSLIYTIIFYGYYILYLTFSLSRFTIIRGYLAPLTLPLDLLIPRIKRISDYKNLPVILGLSRKFRLVKGKRSLADQFPTKGVLEKRFVVDNQLDSYIVKPDEPLMKDGAEIPVVIILPKSKRKKLIELGNHLCKLYISGNKDIIKEPAIESKRLEFAGWILTKRVLK